MSVQAIIDLSDQLYRTLSSHGLSKEAISREAKNCWLLNATKTVFFPWANRLNFRGSPCGSLSNSWGKMMFLWSTMMMNS